MKTKGQNPLNSNDRSYGVEISNTSMGGAAVAKGGRKRIVGAFMVGILLSFILALPLTSSAHCDS